MKYKTNTTKIPHSSLESFYEVRKENSDDRRQNPWNSRKYESGNITRQIRNKNIVEGGLRSARYTAEKNTSIRIALKKFNERNRSVEK